MNQNAKMVLIAYAVAVVLLCVFVPTEHAQAGISGGYEAVWRVRGTFQFDMKRWFVGIVAATAVAGVALALTWTRADVSPRDGDDELDSDG
ncbi:hypothetical protein HN371_28970 [Candidatus Poribacteria bacterium]|nr:hypothetical protein [Candidatus Poribacteria bacterium]MBT5532085.1 hypothetical protein [Candidatus Poribacteria bacterium]